MFSSILEQCDFKSYRLIKTCDISIELNWPVSLNILWFTAECEWKWSRPRCEPEFRRIMTIESFRNIFYFPHLLSWLHLFVLPFLILASCKTIKWSVTTELSPFLLVSWCAHTKKAIIYQRVFLEQLYNHFTNFIWFSSLASTIEENFKLLLV